MRAGIWLVIAAGAVTSAWADPDLSLNFYLTAPSYAGVSDPAFDAINQLDCVELRSVPMSGPAFVWAVVSRVGGWPDGVGGIMFGVEWSDVAMEGWSLGTGGSLIALGGFPDSGTGAAMTYERGCYEPQGESSRLGFFLVSDASHGEMSFTPVPSEGRADVATCRAEVFTIPVENLGSIVFGAEVTPVCAVSSPIRERSWSSIKALYVERGGVR